LKCFCHLFAYAKCCSDRSERRGFSELYGIVKDSNVKRASVVSELFMVTFESTILRKFGVEEIEVEIDINNPHSPRDILV
jgi:hypothetical protein